MRKGTAGQVTSRCPRSPIASMLATSYTKSDGIWNLLLDGVHNPYGEALGPMGARPHSIDIAGPGFDPDEVLAQAADLLFDLLGGSLPNRDTTDEGPHADTHPQHAEHTPEPVARQGTQGNADDEGERHRVSLR